MINTILIGNYVKITLLKSNISPYCVKHGVMKPNAIYCPLCGSKLQCNSIDTFIEDFSYLFKEFKVKIKNETCFYAEWEKTPVLEISQEGFQFQFDLDKLNSDKQKLIKYLSERPNNGLFKLKEVVTIITFNKNEIVFV